MSAGVETVLSNALAPRDEADLAEAVSAARAARSPLLIAGNGSKSAIGRPAQVERTLSTLAMSGITLYEPSEMVIGARAGTPLKLVEETLAARGQALTFEPLDYRVLLGSSGEPTIGAVAAGNLSGPRRIMAGACRDSLIGVRMVNGLGQVVKSGGRVMKNVTGLDLVKLSAGSWGTLGVFSEVIFKVLPMTEQVATLVLHGLDDRRAISALAAGLGSPFEVSGAAHLPASIERVPKTLLRLEGFAASVDYRIGELRRLLRGFGTADVISGETAAGLWRSVRDASFLAEPRGSAVWRISIAPGKAAALVGQLTGVLSIRHFFDWGGGLVWLATDAAEDAGAAVIRAALEGTGGYATLIRAPSEIRASVPVFEPLSEPLMRITSGVKASFDPDRILNPGRMYAGV